jgi:hypothetical protein
MAALLVNSAGLPEPSPEIQRRLQQVHHGLSLRYSPAVQGVWAITKEWERDDPRWEMVKRQEMSPADTWDAVGYLPMDCSPDEAPSYILRIFRNYPKDAVRKLSERMHHYNDTLGGRQVEDAMTEVMEHRDPTNIDSRKVTGKRTRHVIPKG